MDREQAFEELESRMKSINMIRHSLAVEAMMKAFGRHFKEDEEKWALTGLLHDIDYEKTCNEPEKHGLVAAEILDSLGMDEAIIYAIKAHNEINGLERKRKLDKVLYCADPLSGFIVACALILPSKKLKDVNAEFVLNRMNEKNFAASVNRDQIKTCSEVGIQLEDFIGISLNALKMIASELGL